jgi:hypothetical protein
MTEKNAAGRKAYPSTPLDLMVSHGIGIKHGVADIANVLINGKRLGEIIESARTPNKYEIRPETKYREGFSIAVAAVRLGLKDAEIDTKHADGTDRERPDGLLRFEGREVGVEAVRVAPTQREHDFVMNLQRELLNAVEADAALKMEGYLVTFRLAADAIRGLSGDERKTLKGEILGLLHSRTLTLMPPQKGMITVFAAGSIAERAGMTVFIEDRTHRTTGFMPQVLLERDAKSDSLIQPILDQIAGKVAGAKSPGYDLSRPLWLVVEVADQSGLFTDSIKAMPACADIEPFEQVVVTDGMTHSVITAQNAGNSGAPVLV